jgi:hypothetical protein
MGRGRWRLKLSEHRREILRAIRCADADTNRNCITYTNADSNGIAHT